MELLKYYEASQLCPECKVIRTSRSRHCSVCHRCVERFDHHCPWINNCVGVKNHRVFLCFIIFQLILLAFSLFITLYSMSQVLAPSITKLWGSFDYEESLQAEKVVRSSAFYFFNFQRSNILLYIAGVQIVLLCGIFLVLIR